MGGNSDLEKLLGKLPHEDVAEITNEKMRADVITGKPHSTNSERSEIAEQTNTTNTCKAKPENTRQQLDHQEHNSEPGECQIWRNKNTPGIQTGSSTSRSETLDATANNGVQRLSIARGETSNPQEAAQHARELAEREAHHNAVPNEAIRAEDLIHQSKREPLRTPQQSQAKQSADAGTQTLPVIDTTNKEHKVAETASHDQAKDNASQGRAIEPPDAISQGQLDKANIGKTEYSTTKADQQNERQADGNSVNKRDISLTSNSVQPVPNKVLDRVQKERLDGQSQHGIDQESNVKGTPTSIGGRGTADYDSTQSVRCNSGRAGGILKETDSNSRASAPIDTKLQSSENAATGNVAGSHHAFNSAGGSQGFESPNANNGLASASGGGSKGLDIANGGKGFGPNSGGKGFDSGLDGKGFEGTSDSKGSSIGKGFNLTGSSKGTDTTGRSEMGTWKGTSNDAGAKFQDLIDRMGRTDGPTFKDARTANSIGLDSVKRGDGAQSGSFWNANFVPADWLTSGNRRTTNIRFGDPGVQAAVEQKKLDATLASQLSDPLTRTRATKIITDVMEGNLRFDPKSKEARAVDALRGALGTGGLDRIRQVLSEHNKVPRFDLHHFDIKRQEFIQRQLDILLNHVRKETERKPVRSEGNDEMAHFVDRLLDRLNRKHLIHLIDGIKDFQITRSQTRQLANEVNKFNGYADLDKGNGLRVRDVFSQVFTALTQSFRNPNFLAESEKNSSRAANNNNKTERDSRTATGVDSTEKTIKIKSENTSPATLHSAANGTNILAPGQGMNNRRPVAAPDSKNIATQLADRLEAAMTNQPGSTALDPVLSRGQTKNSKPSSADATQTSSSDHIADVHVSAPANPVDSRLGAPRPKRELDEENYTTPFMYAQYTDVTTVGLPNLEISEADAVGFFLSEVNRVAKRAVEKSDSGDITQSQSRASAGLPSNAIAAGKRKTYVTNPGESLQSIARDIFADSDVAVLLADINAAMLHSLPNTTVSTVLPPKTRISLPMPAEIARFQRATVQSMTGAGTNSAKTNAKAWSTPSDELTAKYGPDWDGAQTRQSLHPSTQSVSSEQTATVQKALPNSQEDLAEFFSPRKDVRCRQNTSKSTVTLEILDPRGNWKSIVSYRITEQRSMRTAEWSRGLRLLRIDLPISIAQELAVIDLSRNWHRYCDEYMAATAR